MQNPPMLFTVPNAMSDFLAQCIVDATGWRYSREWWNTNEPHHASRWREQAHMGSRVSIPEMESQVKVWDSHGFQFAKECMNAWRLDAFSRFFDLIVMIPSQNINWPPNRERIRRTYHHLYTMALGRGMVPLDVAQSLTIDDMPTAGFYYYRKLLLRESVIAGCRGLYCSSLMDASQEELTWTLDRNWPSLAEHAEPIAKNIVERRRAVPRPDDDGASNALLTRLETVDP